MRRTLSRDNHDIAVLTRTAVLNGDVYKQERLEPRASVIFHFLSISCRFLAPTLSISRNFERDPRLTNRATRKTI